MKKINVTARDVDVLARTIFGEARGEYFRREGGLASFMAVANVVMNRVSQQSRFGKTVAEVCMKPRQFSCWNPQDSNAQIIRTVTRDSDPLFALCLNVAEKVAQGEWPDLTHGSDHYYALTMPKAPLWAVGQSPKIKIGQHVFYKL